eukprot:6020099-Pyramimonas_sp.AAC.1
MWAPPLISGWGWGGRRPKPREALLRMVWGGGAGIGARAALTAVHPTMLGDGEVATSARFLHCRVPGGVVKVFGRDEAHLGCLWPR